VLRPWISATAFPPFIVGAAIALLGWKAPFIRRKAPVWTAVALVTAWLASAAVFTAVGHDLGRWERAGLLPVVALGIGTAWTVADLAGLPRQVAGEAGGADGGGATAVRTDRRDRWLAAALYVAPLSFLVYVTQEPALAVCKNLVERAGPGMPPVAAYLVPPAVVIGLAVAAGLALRRVLPRTFAVATGGRVPKAAAEQDAGPTAQRDPAEPDAAEPAGPGELATDARSQHA
jgi:hypothetical protein